MRFVNEEAGRDLTWMFDVYLREADLPTLEISRTDDNLELVWNVPEVVAESQRFVTIKVDATDPDDAEMEKIKEAFKVPGLPRVIFIDSRGEVLHGRSVGFLKADEMLALMKSIR